MGLQPALGDRVAVAWRNGSRQHQSDLAMVELQHLCIAHRNAAFLARHQVTQLQCIAVVWIALQNDAGVALGQRFFVTCSGGTLGCNLALELLAVELHIHSHQHSAKGQRKGVSDFGVRIAGVAKPLLQAHGQ